MKRIFDVEVVVPLLLILLLCFVAVYGHHVRSYQPEIMEMHQR